MNEFCDKYMNLAEKYQAENAKLRAEVDRLDKCYSDTADLLDSAIAEKTALRAEVLDLRRLMGHWSTVDLALKAQEKATPTCPCHEYRDHNARKIVCSCCAVGRIDESKGGKCPLCDLPTASESHRQECPAEPKRGPESR